jgi:streptogramin lyase
LLAADGSLRDDGTQDNRLYRYSPADDNLTFSQLPGYGGVTPNVRMALAGKTIVIGWGDHLFSIDPSTTAISAIALPAPHDASPSRSALIEDIAADGETVWIARAGLASLAVIDSAGNVREYALPGGDGWPHRIAVGTSGHIWSSVAQHDPKPSAAGLERVSAFAVTLELDPSSGKFTSHALPSADLSSNGTDLVAVGGSIGGARMLSPGDVVTSISDAAGTNPDDVVVTDSERRNVWYTSNEQGVIVTVFADGRSAVANLSPVTTTVSSSCPVGISATVCAEPVRLSNQVGGIAIGSTGELWFSAMGSRSISKVLLN